ncbi:MAG: hypothetical protein Kow00107_09810 [Planctomycetota bacterium]
MLVRCVVSKSGDRSFAIPVEHVDSVREFRTSPPLPNSHPFVRSLGTDGRSFAILLAPKYAAHSRHSSVSAILLRNPANPSSLIGLVLTKVLGFEEIEVHPDTFYAPPSWLLPESWTLKGVDRSGHFLPVLEATKVLSFFFSESTEETSQLELVVKNEDRPNR